MNEDRVRGILLFNKISSENNLFLKFLTENDEILTGLSFGASTKKNKNIFQIGYFLEITSKKKNNFPNNIKAELSKPYYHNIFNDKYKLHCLLAVISLLNISIIEGQKVNGLFNLSEELIQTLVCNDRWIIDFFLYLLNLLKLIGYEIDFNKNSLYNYFNLKTLEFNNFFTSQSIKFPHDLLSKREPINNENAISFFKIFEIIFQNHHLNNMNLNIPVNYLKFKKLILNFLSK
jgi:hypothetical protein